LEAGWLSGRYDATSTFDAARARWTPEDIAHRAELVDELRTILPNGISMPQATLAFILAHHEVSTIIPGIKSIDQLHANRGAAELTLSDDVIEAIHALGAKKTEELPW
jgi:aryl-alcohol dehydrogenase-like predicted oxidoreductase